MAIQTIAMPGYTVNPTENDIIGDLTTGAGRALQEIYLVNSLRGNNGGPGRLISGFAMPTSGTRTAATVTAGTAIVGGYYVTGTDTISFSAEDATTSWVWLQLTTSSSLVTGVQLYVVSGATKPAGPTEPALFLGTIVTAGGSITSGPVWAQSGRIVWGALTVTLGAASVLHYGSGDWTIGQVGSTVTITFPAFLRIPMKVGLEVQADPTTTIDVANSTTTAAFEVGGSTRYFFMIIG